MEFNEKLAALRKQKGITQDKLAEALYVSRTAISKWESGRGYPNIESLKAIAHFFDITVDELLSTDELLTIAEQDAKRREKHFCDLVFGLLDISAALLLFLPFFGQKSGEIVLAVSLLSLTQIAPYLKILYYITVFGIILLGTVTLALQSVSQGFWIRSKRWLSFILNLVGVILFVISPQPYAASLLLVMLAIKAVIFVKKR